MKPNRYPLDINSDTFNGMKLDFNQILRETLLKMTQQEDDEAKITISIKIKLTEDQVPDAYGPVGDEKRNIWKPKFDHTVQSVIQAKDEKKGTLGGNYELVWDKTEGSFVIVEIVDQNQTSLYDSEDEITDDGYAYEDAYESQ